MKKNLLIFLSLVVCGYLQSHKEGAGIQIGSIAQGRHGATYESDNTFVLDEVVIVCDHLGQSRYGKIIAFDDEPGFYEVLIFPRMPQITRTLAAVSLGKIVENVEFEELIDEDQRTVVDENDIEVEIVDLSDYNVSENVER